MIAKTDRNRDIRRRAMSGQTQQAIADDYGVSRQRVDQIIHLERQEARRRSSSVEIPDGTPCQRCGRRKARHRHHDDYVDAMGVEFLCLRCHVLADREVAERRARHELGFRPDVPLETITEARERTGLQYYHIREGVDTGAILAHKGRTTFVVPSEVDAWSAFLAARASARQAVQGATKCHRGHLMAAWNRSASDVTTRSCRACNSLHANGQPTTDLPTRYELCLAMHIAGWKVTYSHGMRIHVVHPDGELFQLSRGGTTAWIVRRHGHRLELGRASTAEGVRGIILHALSGNGNGA